MNLPELEARLVAAGVDPRDWVLGELPRRVAPRDGSLFVGEQTGQWFVGGTDRGRNVVSVVLADEDSACVEALRRLLSPRLPSVRWTADDHAEACRKAQASADQMRDPGVTSPVAKVLHAGDVVDRFGADFGRSLYPAGTAFAERALPPDLLDPTLPGLGLRVFVVRHDIDVLSSLVQPWFGQPGGAVVHELQGTHDVASLVDQGALALVELVREA